VRVNPAYREAVEGLSLTRFGEAMGYIGGESVESNRKRSVVKLAWKGETFFFKRFLHPPVKDGLARLLRGRGPKTHGAVEWEIAEALRGRGIGAPEVAAVGVEAGFGLRKRSFLLTAALRNATPLWRVLAGEGDRLPRLEDRRALVASLARTVRAMHEGGISHPDLYSYHLFLVEGEGPPSFALIDLHRASHKARVSLFEAARDLTGLHLTVPPPLASRSDRLRFLRHYFGGGRLSAAARRLARKVLRRAKRIGKRRRFREMAASGAGASRPRNENPEGREVRGDRNHEGHEGGTKEN
jgi:heptose I phosphotransferase